MVGGQPTTTVLFLWMRNFMANRTFWSPGKPYIFVVLYKSFYATKIIESYFGDRMSVHVRCDVCNLRFGTENTTDVSTFYGLDEILVGEHFTTRGLIFGFLCCCCCRRIHFGHDNLVQTKRRLERV